MFDLMFILELISSCLPSHHGILTQEYLFKKALEGPVNKQQDIVYKQLNYANHINGMSKQM